MTRALVIDDDIGSAELMRVVLEDAEIQVTVARSEAQIPRETFDVIVTDLVSVTAYTTEDARDWVLRVADRFPRAPILVVTAHTEARRDQTALGASAVLLKPFDVDELTRTVRELTIPTS